MNSIKDKVIMITGASSGFGMITAEKCVSLGAKVILGARRKDRLEELCNKSTKKGFFSRKKDKSGESLDKELLIVKGA